MLVKRRSNWNWRKLPLALAAALTAVLLVRTFWYLFHSITNVPYTDHWLLLDEIRRFQNGESRWTYLWQPYWGQRNLVARLLLLLDAKWLSYTTLPLILVNVAAQVLLWLVLSWRRPLVCVVAFAHLLFSSLGMELLVIAQNVQHSIGYASAVAAIVLYESRPRLAIALAVLATGCLAIGLLVWPILIAEAYVFRRGKKTLAGIAALIFAIYLIGYTRPAIGMGPWGALHRPLTTLAMTALVLGGPISLYSLRLGTIAGAVGLAAAAAGLRRPQEPLMWAVWFVAASSLSLAVGRISPEWIASLHGTQPLPSRYIALALIFWACLFGALIRDRVILAAVAAIVLVMTFGTWPWQWRVSREWAVAMQKFDAIGSGFLLGVDDPELMSQLLADDSRRNQLVEYMNRQRLAVFSEPRASWVDQPVPASSTQQRVTIVLTPLSTPKAFRVTGNVDLEGRVDLLLADDSGAVRGLARTMPADAEGKFLGYVRIPEPGRIRIFARTSRTW